MAIDGVGIMESDFAHDIYNLIMEMYHRGEAVGKIKVKANEFGQDCRGIDCEIFHTVYAQAMWEIGELSDKQLQDVRDIVKKGADRKWGEIHPEAQEERQSILYTFLQKIEQPNLKIKQPGPYKSISNTLFSKGEILALLIGGCYRCVIFENFYRHRNDAFYSFVVTTYDSEDVPDAERILLEEIPVTKMSGTGERGIRTLDIYYKFVEAHKAVFQKCGSISIDPQAEHAGFPRQVGELGDLEELEHAMDDILLGEKAELFLYCLF